MNNIEETLAYELIVAATDRLSCHLGEEDLEAAIIGALIRAVEIASQRKVKPIYEIYETKPVLLGGKEALVVHKL